jgi:hypothetical protein
VQQEVVLAMLAKEPSCGYQLRARLREALGPLGDAMNDGQVYVTLTRMEKAGLVTSEQAAGTSDRPDRKVYVLTPSGPRLGVPLGIELFKAANGAGLTEVPPIPWLVATVLGALVAVALLTSIPARIDARRPVGEILQSEAV